MPSRTKKQSEFRQWVAVGLLLASCGGLVKLLVVGKRMRIGARHVRMHQRRALPRPAMFRRALQQRRNSPRDRFRRTPRRAGSDSRDQPRNAASRRLHLHRHGYRPAVIFHQEQHRQALQASGVQRLEEFSLAGHPLAAGDVDDLVPAVPRRAPLWGVLRLIQRFRKCSKYTEASAAPTACSHCIPAVEERVTRFSSGLPQCEGI